MRGVNGDGIFNEIISNYSHKKIKEDKREWYHYGMSNVTYKCACSDCNNEINTCLYSMQNYVYKLQKKKNGKNLTYYTCSWNCLNKLREELRGVKNGKLE